MKLGEEAIAVEAATEVGKRIDALEPLLLELGESKNDESCRKVSWHLAFHYRRLHPEGARRGFVRLMPFDASAEVFLVLTGDPERAAFPRAAVLYPRGRPTFDDAEARRCLDLLLPPDVRGELVPYGMPGDGDVPGTYVLREEAFRRHAAGAIVSFRFHGTPLRTRRRASPEALSTQHWERVSIYWNGAALTWSPERLVGGRRAHA